jgi:hypothetical protein
MQENPKHHLFIRSFLVAVVTLGLSCLGSNVFAQSYKPTYGSAFAGSTSIFNNPASSVNQSFKWEATILSAQANVNSNAFYIQNDSIGIHEGMFPKYFHGNVDVNLLNLLYKPNNKQAFSVGIRARTFNHVKTEPLVVSNGIQSMHDFFMLNRETPYLEAFMTHSGWLEGNFNYSQEILRNQKSTLTAGITLQINKSISGAYATVNKLSYLESTNGIDTLYTLTAGGSSFGYSSNYDETTAGTSNSGSDFLKNGKSSLGLSIGAEYLLYNTEAHSFQTNHALNYALKIGVSIMDIGGVSYKNSVTSSIFNGVRPNMNDPLISRKTTGLENSDQLRDSLATIFASTTQMPETFTVTKPTRFNVNIDKPLGSNFYINADLTVNMHASAGLTKRRVRDLNLITLTPRYESLHLGVYLPVQYNTQGQLMVGGALKLGPLTVGVHRLRWLTNSSNMSNPSGGGYVMLSIHPMSLKKIKTIIDCPE